MISNLPVRKSVRLESFRYRGQKRYFVTICCHNRKQIFNDENRARWILRLLDAESGSRFFAIRAHCVMPDHLHFLAEGMDAASDLQHFIKSFKIKSNRRYSEETGKRMWQRGFYEHILRAADSVESVAWYIWMNPVRKGRVSRPQEYLFLGSFTGMKMPAAWDEAAWCPPWKRIRCTEV